MQNITGPYSPKDYLSIKTENQFNDMALASFHYQHATNKVYRQFCEYLKIKESNIRTPQEIPFLPIEFFKHHQIVSGKAPIVKIFKSSGTTGVDKSMHCLVDEEIYKVTLLEGFRRRFGNPSKYSFLALLPGYLDRDDSSLIYMVHELMKKSNMKNNQFFKEANEDLIRSIQYNQQNEIDTILFGVSFSLLEFANKNSISLENVNVVETGGMKGQKEEITRLALHTLLKDKFQISKISSEYGMTELLSQAYTVENEIFESPPWMQVIIREMNDPRSFAAPNVVGGINVIDLANLHSCCFISTQDLGKKTSPNNFEVLGRFDNADMRGCNLLFSND